MKKENTVGPALSSILPLLWTLVIGLCSLWTMVSDARGQMNMNLLHNDGFEAGSEPALSGWERLSQASAIALDEQVRHSGKRSLRVTDRGGVRTALVPYQGGRVRVSGWVKTDRIVTGSRPWYKAALQLISYDEARKGVGHSDVALVDGTHDWTRHERTIQLSRSVAYVAVHCHIWGPDAKGAAWFDDIALEFLDDPKALPQRPVELAQATVTVDFSKDLGEFRHLWVGSDASWFDLATSPTQVNAMRHAKQFGFRHIRLHDCIFNPRIYSEDAAGRAVFNWERFDRGVGAVVDNGLWPVIVLETMPTAIAGRDDGRNWTNPHPPKGPEGYLKWQRVVHELVKHCKAKWGDEIHNWYFEVWNEPDSSGYFRGTLEEYLKIYDHAVAGATSADPKIRIGGPGGAGAGWCRPLLEHCRSGRNDATGGTGCRIDFLSWHIYTVGVGIPVLDNVRLSVSTVRKALEEFPEYRSLPTLITEWGCASSPHPVHDRPYDAAFRTLAVRVFMDGGITLALPFSLGEGPPHAHDGFQGGLALFTKTTIPKPSFRAFELLHRMVGRRVECESSNDPVGGLACLSADGRKAWAMLYNLIEKHDREPYETAVTVKLVGLPKGGWKCQGTAIAPGKCDPYLAWEAMGRPDKLTPAQRESLLKASEAPPPQPLAIAQDAILTNMPGFSVLLLELQKE